MDFAEAAYIVDRRLTEVLDFAAVDSDLTERLGFEVGLESS